MLQAVLVDQIDADLALELSDGQIVIRAYEPGIELAVLEAARESAKEIGPAIRTGRDGVTYEEAGAARR